MFALCENLTIYADKNTTRRPGRGKNGRFAAAALCTEKGAHPEVALSDYAEDFRRRAEKADEDGKTDDFAL